MQKADAVNHFGGVGKLAAQLGISRQAIHAWGETVPELWAYKIHHLSEGNVPLEPQQEPGRAQ